MAQISITLVRADTNQEFEVELPDDVTMQDLLPALVKELGLPEHGPDGNRVAYELSSKATGQNLHDKDTFSNKSAKNGDLFLLTSTFVAGARGPVSVSLHPHPQASRDGIVAEKDRIAHTLYLKDRSRNLARIDVYAVSDCTNLVAAIEKALILALGDNTQR